MRALSLTISLIAVTLGGCAMAPPSIPPPEMLHGPAQPNPEGVRRSEVDVYAATASSLTLEEAMAFGLSNNPRLQAEYQRVEDLLLEVPQVSSLDDPMFEAESREAYRGPDDDRENMIGISQTFPWFGKRTLRGLIAGSEAAQALYEYRVSVLETRRDIQVAWWRAAYSRENAVLLVEEQRLVKEAREATLALYQSGRRDRASLLRLDTEDAMIAGQREENDGLGRAAHHDLERLMSASLTEITMKGDLRNATLATDPEFARLLDVAHEYRPELATFAEAEKRAGLQERLARADYYPDLTVGAGLSGMGMRSSSYYEIDSDDRTDSWRASVGLNIPIPNARRRAAVEQAQKRAEEARLWQDAVANQIMQEIGSASAMISSLNNQSRLYTSSIIPIADEAYQSTRAAYETGAATYADLIDVQRTLVAARREHLRILRDLAITSTELERVVGAPLSVVALWEGIEQ